MALQLSFTSGPSRRSLFSCTRSCDQFLAGAGLAADQHRRVGGRDQRHLRERVLERGTASDDGVAHGFGDLALEVLVLLLQPDLEGLDFGERVLKLAGARDYSGFELGVGTFELALQRAPRDVRLHARQHFLVLERLGHVIVGARGECAHLVLALGQRGHEYHRHLRQRGEAAHAARGLEAVDARHHRVHEHERGRRVSRLFERALAVGRHAHAVSGLRQRLDQEAEICGSIVDHQDGSGGVGAHVRPPRASSSRRRTAFMSKFRARRRSSSYTGAPSGSVAIAASAREISSLTSPFMARS